MPSRRKNQSKEDTEMQDAPAATQNEVAATESNNGRPMLDSGLDDGEKQRIRVLRGDTPTAASFEFTDEDHTLGNALRYVIMKNPDVEFCGYSIPHPSDNKMNIRIQTYDDVNVFDVLEKGLHDLSELCDVMIDKFVDAKNNFAPKESS